MQPVTLSDLGTAARVLLAVPEAQRRLAMAALIRRAETADRHLRATGALLPGHGNGTLMSAALGLARRDPSRPGDEDYLNCLACALDAVLAWRADQAGARD